MSETFVSSSASVCLEPPVEFTKPLEDQTVEEDSTVTLECTLSRENAEVRWFRDGQELRKTKKFDLVSLGCKRMLVIHNCTPEDMKMYTCDAKEFKTSCFLDVTRKDKTSPAFFKLGSKFEDPGVQLCVCVWPQRLMWSSPSRCRTLRSEREKLPGLIVKYPVSRPR